MRIQIEADHLHCMLVAEVNQIKGSSRIDASYALYPIVAKLNNKGGGITEYIPMIPVVRMDVDITGLKPTSVEAMYTQTVSWFSEMLQEYEPISDVIEFPQSHSLGNVYGIKGSEKTIKWYMNTMTLTIVHGDKEHRYEITQNGLKLASTIVYDKKTGEEFRMYRKDKWWSELAKTLPPKK